VFGPFDLLVTFKPPNMSFQMACQTLGHVVVVYLPFAAAVAALAIAYHVKTQADVKRPFKGFPLVGLEEDGLTPEESWQKYGYRVMMKGLKEHQSAFQVMTGTGPKVWAVDRRFDESQALTSVHLDLTTEPLHRRVPKASQGKLDANPDS
jgi:hypothetical protein